MSIYERCLTLGSVVGAMVVVPWLMFSGCSSEETAPPSTTKSTSKQAGTVFTPKTAGKACTADKDCGNGMCSKQFAGALGGSQVAPGGYCTFPCQLDADCGDGASCVGANAGGTFGLGGTSTASMDGVCLATCTSSSQCREGYRCFDALGQAVEAASTSATGGGAAGSGAAAAVSGAATCGIAPATDKLAAGVAGTACGADGDCRGGRCMTSDVLMMSYPDGYCTGSCVADGDCGDGATCSAAFGGMAGTCYRKCEADRDCPREGYRCRGSVFPPGSAKRCMPGSAPLPDGVVGDACAKDADCGSSAVCTQSMPGMGMNTQRPLPGGYCSGSCVEDLDCGQGGKCIGSFGGVTMGTCYLGCAMDTDCRAGYACTSVGFGGFGGVPGGFGNFGGAAMGGMQTKVCGAPQPASDQDAGVN